MQSWLLLRLISLMDAPSLGLVTCLVVTQGARRSSHSSPNWKGHRVQAPPPCPLRPAASGQARLTQVDAAHLCPYYLGVHLLRQDPLPPRAPGAPVLRLPWENPTVKSGSRGATSQRGGGRSRQIPSAGEPWSDAAVGFSSETRSFGTEGNQLLANK